jgi:alkanesulfonate monooxygenase SsuD/methylene tetrahydromethanopterin reductase-like flavin-dependent oxidoreductase (luciferase family)
MRFGYFTLTDNPPGYGERRQDPNRLLQHVLAQCVEADRLGYASVWVPEHHFGLFGVLPTPTTFLAAVAARTRRVKLAAATVLLPCNQPLRVAEEWALLDLLSDGRAIFSAGRGYDEREYRAFEVPYAESRSRFDEELEIVRSAWTREDWTFRGQHHVVPDPITVYPRPVQRPHLPVYVACFSEPTVRAAARLGFNVIFAPFAAAMMFGSLQRAADAYRGFCREYGRPEGKVMCSYFTVLADTAADQQAARERLLYYLQSVAPAFPADRDRTPPHIAYFADIVDRIRAMKPEDLGERSIVSGTTDQVVEQLRRVEAAGIEEVICYFNFGGYPHEATLQQMRRFAAEVMPRFEPAPGLVAAARS